MVKKIIILSINLLFSSVQAQALSEADIIAELVKNAEFVASVHTLCEQGLTHEQMVEQLMQTGEASAYLMPGDPVFENKKNKREPEFRAEEILLTLGFWVAFLVVGFYFELQSQK